MRKILLFFLLGSVIASGAFAAATLQKRPQKIGSNVVRSSVALAPSSVGVKSSSGAGSARLSIGSLINKNQSPGSGTPGTGGASSSDIENLERQIDDLQKQIDDIESRTPADASDVYTKGEVDDLISLGGGRVEISVNGGMLQYRNAGDAAWTDLASFVNVWSE
jgi:hypothetical protein